MAPQPLRWPMMLQITAVIVLFSAALGMLWHTSSSVVGREERRALSKNRLKQASDLLAIQGKAALAGIRPYPEFMTSDEWSAIAERLNDAANRVHARFPEVDGGYYLPDRRISPFQPAFGSATSNASSRSPSSTATVEAVLYDYIETQANAAYRKKSPLLVVEDVPPDTVAIRAAPIAGDGRVVAATWSMIRLEDPIFLDHPTLAYRLFVGLALMGIVTSTLLTFKLVATIRRQSAERDRLQLHLRRTERLAALGKLLAGVAHEVRNPLAGIRSTAQLWQRGLGIDNESLTGLVHEVDRLELIVSNLLQFSRADPQHKLAGDLNEVLAEAARLATPSAAAGGVRIDLGLDSDLPEVEMTPSALLQIFRNLTTNAIQAMSDGGIIVLSTRHDSATGQVLAAVSDTGTGLEPEALSHLFEPFFTTKAEGTGLGLAIAREIALAHGGDLLAENRPEGNGAIFTVVLPVAITTTEEGRR